MTIFEFLKNPIGAIRSFSFDGFKSLFDTAFGQSESNTGMPAAFADAASTSDSASEETQGDTDTDVVMAFPPGLALVDSFWLHPQDSSQDWWDNQSYGAIHEYFLPAGFSLLEQEQGEFDAP